ncbi:MAG: adenosine deaminase [Phototrophicales bacterium]|nr:MAG: adenosine deaminase [Phototrophicales bacterium]
MRRRRAQPLIDQDAVDAIRAMPKIELHRHLEGSLRLETLLAIALEHQITMPRFDVDGLRPFVQIMPGETRSMTHFLNKFAVLRMFYRSEKIIKRVTAEVVADAAHDNVRYMELRFTPQALNNLIQCTFDQIVGWVCEAATQSAAEHHIQVGLIISMNRHEPLEIGEHVLDAALRYADYGVVGLDLAGREFNYKAQPFRGLFERAHEAGLGVTIHAGEWSGADSVREAVCDLGAERIGHGVRAAEDRELCDLLADRGTVLEVCPTSNYHSGVVSGYDTHPLTTLIQRGVRTTINTDDPLISNITLSDELVNVTSFMPLSLTEVKRQQLIAAEAAFLKPEARAKLVSQFREWMALS